MYKNYLLIAWRNIIRNGFHSVINISGLAIGIAFTLLTAGYIWEQAGVNRSLKNSENQYILQSRWKDPNMGYYLGTIGALPRALKEQYPALVANYYRYDGITSNVSRGEKIFREPLQVGDSSILNMYGFTMLYGDVRTALSDPFSLVLTERSAIKYFGKSDVLNQMLTIESFSGTRHDFKITGVIKDPSQNSVTHLSGDEPAQVFIPATATSFFKRDLESWNNPNIAGFIELQPGVKPHQLDGPIKTLLNKHAPPFITQNLTPYIVSLPQYYLDVNNGLVRKMLYTLCCTAIFILVMAVINFVNISISKASLRLKEIGVRKVLGSLRKQLFVQFLLEATLMVSIATLLSIGIYMGTAPFLSNVLGKPIPSLLSFPVLFVVVPLVLVVLIGLLSGIYPALVLSGLKAADSIKGKLGTIREHVLLRKSLVAFQFCTASIVLTGAIIISKQVNLFFKKDLGYDREYVVSAQVPRNWTLEGVQKTISIRDRFAEVPGVKSVTLSYSIPDGNIIGSVPVIKAGEDSASAVTTLAMVTDEQYAATYKIPMAAGAYFERKSAADSLSVVLNESAVKALGYKTNEDALNQYIHFMNSSDLRITGVVRDFHSGSMQAAIQPMAFFNVDLWNNYRFLSFKLAGRNISKAIADLQITWSQLFPGAAFEYRFMDDTLKKIYTTEIQLKKASEAATALAVIIVLLGVTGLVSISIQKRTKEIGIRKVLGAQTGNIVYLFLKDFLPVIGVAVLIGMLPAYLIMNEWLNNYNYKIAMNVLPFISSLVFLLLITTILITYRISRASVQNPVKNLRNE